MENGASNGHSHAAATDTSKEAIDYKQWLQSQGVQSDGCEIAIFEQTGRGALATRSFSPGDVVIQVRRRSVLSYLSMLQCNRCMLHPSG
jgi:hypothetical protein